MKRTILICAMVLACAGSAFAQADKKSLTNGLAAMTQSLRFPTISSIASEKANVSGVLLSV